MKGVILGIAPKATIVDLTHEVPPQDVRAGSYLLRTALAHFPPGTVHVAVVDPGVGTERRPLLVETAAAFFVAPDNGLLSLAVTATEVIRVRDVSRSRYLRRPISRTFHGRDVFAPVAAHLAAGADPESLGRPVRGMIRLRPRAARRRRGALVGHVIWVDRFGNLITDIARDDLVSAGGFCGRGLSVTIAGCAVPLRRSYASVRAGRALALVNSADLIEIAVNQGSAAAALGVERGAPVVVGRV
jgi:hypothetical protein